MVVGIFTFPARLPFRPDGRIDTVYYPFGIPTFEFSLNRPGCEVVVRYQQTPHGAVHRRDQSRENPVRHLVLPLRILNRVLVFEVVADAEGRSSRTFSQTAHLLAHAERRADESLAADEVVVRPLGCSLCAEIGDQTLVAREFIGYVPQQFLGFVFGVAYQYEVNVLAVDPEP